MDVGIRPANGYAAFGGPTLARTMRWKGRTRTCSADVRPSMRAVTVSTAARPMAKRDWRMVVSAGEPTAAKSMSSKPMTPQSRDVPEGIDFADLRRRFSGRTITNNQLTLELCERELAEGRADLFSFRRPYIANPDLVHRLATGGPLAEAPKSTWYGGDSHGYSDWPGMEGPVEVRR